MQEIHSIGGGRFFDGGGGGGDGDRRLRPHHHNNQQNQQALKCPRCDSLNTKFCYYNNYNLSQPRHFCKSCRRYWTKGGVLRNVPVGGGCRKSKRSKPKSSSSLETVVREAPPPPPPPSTTQLPNQDHHKSNSHSSSDSSSLTAAATEAASVPSSSNCELYNNQSSNPNFESGVMEQAGDSGIFSEIGSFTSMISATSEALSFGFGSIPETSSFRFGCSTTTQQGGMGNELLSGEWHAQAQQKEIGMSDVVPPQQELKLPEIMPGPLLDQTVPVDLSELQSKTENGGFGSLDWQGTADQGLFDLPNTVDHAYWSHAHWTDQDNPGGLFHLP